MNYPPQKGLLALAIYPSTRGFGFALFEGPSVLIDWGTKETRIEKNQQCLVKIEALIDFYEPDVVIVEDASRGVSRRSKRIQRLIQDINALAIRKKLKRRSYSRAMIKEFFSEFGAATKPQIAQTIAGWLPELKPRLPPVRKIWMSEDPRMAIFDAVALVLTFFYFENKKTQV
jgi:Holliday junction resolvasome RuvABC endonuclease subunit